MGSRASLVLLVGTFMSGGCVLPSAPDAVPPPRVEVLGSGGQAAQYGTEARQIFDHPALRTHVRALFGRDWDTANAGRLSSPVTEYFARSSPPTRLRIDNTEWIAVPGCAPAACAKRRGLVLIAPGGDRLLARVDDGGFSHAYGYGPGMGSLAERDRALVDAAWRALG